MLDRVGTAYRRTNNPQSSSTKIIAITQNGRAAANIRIENVLLNGGGEGEWK